MQTGKLSIADEIMISTYFLITVNFSGAIVILLLSDRDHIQRAMDVQWVCVAVQWICTPLTFVFALYTGQPAFAWIIIIACCLSVLVVFAKFLPGLRWATGGLPHRSIASSSTHTHTSCATQTIAYSGCANLKLRFAGIITDIVLLKVRFMYASGSFAAWIWGATSLCQHAAIMLKPQVTSPAHVSAVCCWSSLGTMRLDPGMAMPDQLSCEVCI